MSDTIMAWTALFVAIPIMAYCIRHIDNNTLFRYLRMSAGERHNYVFVMRSLMSVLALLLIALLVITANPALWQAVGDYLYLVLGQH